MPEVTETIPNLVTGVSQQPDALRLPTSAKVSINGWPSEVRGMGKRPPTQHVSALTGVSGTDTSFFHWIDRDTSERYVVVIADGGIKVFDLAGNEKTVNTPDGVSYLASADARSTFRGLTVADYTFIVNTGMVVRKSAAKTPPRTNEAIVWVRSGNYAHTYTVGVDGHGSSAVTTPNGSNGASDAAFISTQLIASALVTHGVSLPPGGTYGGAALNAMSGLSVSLSNSVIRILRTSTSTPIRVNTTDGLGGQAMRVLTETTQSVADLPKNGWNGFKTKIIGENNEASDDYWVEFKAQSGTSGVWEEAPAPDTHYALDAATMPHILVRESDGTFTFRQADWGSREAGDDLSNPFPSFVDRKITSVFFYRNRLAFTAGDNFIASEAGEFFNFFRRTATTLLDSDPVDVSAAHTKAVNLYAAVPISGQLVLFSEQTQFLLSSNGPLTASSVQIDPFTEYKASPGAAPVTNGPFVYFPVETGDFTHLQEFYVAQETSSRATEAVDITKHVPAYIPKSVFHMAATTTGDLLTVLSEEDPSRVYVFRYYIRGEERLLNSWGVWDFPNADAVLSVEFFNATMYAAVLRGSAVYLEKMDLPDDRPVGPTDFDVYLDQRLMQGAVSASYSAGETEFTLPYAASEGTQVFTAQGVLVPVKARAGNTITVSGDYATGGPALFIGTRYAHQFSPAQFNARQRTRDGGSAVITEGRLQVRRARLAYAGAGYFRVEVTPDFRPTSVTEFTGRVLGRGTNVLGEVSLDDGVCSFAVQSKNDQVEIAIINDSPLPAWFVSMEWTGNLTLRSSRL
jgi:hypothetical protein